MTTETLHKPVKNEIDPKQFGEYAEQRKELKEIFDPLANLAAERIERAINKSPDDIRELLSEIKVDELPYGDVYLFLPPGFLEGKERSLETPEGITGYAKADWLFDQIEEYVKEKQTSGTPYEKNRYKDIDVEQTRIRNLPVEVPLGVSADLRGMQKEFNPEKWDKHEKAYRRYREQGNERDFYRLLEVRTHNGHNRYDAPANYDSFSYVKAHLAEENRVIDNIIVPVGAYGKEFADNLAKSTLFIIEGLEMVISDDAQKVASEHHEILREFTARGRDAGENLDARSTIQTIQEGVLSVVQVAALLTSDKVEGYSDPSHLLHDVIDQGLIEKVTRLLPMALIGPITLRGKRFPNPIEVQPDGSLGFTVAFTQWLHKAHIDHWQSVMANKDATGNHPKIGMGLTCPASGKGGGVGAMAHTLDSVYQTVA